MNTFSPAEAFPPGDFLREELEVRGWSQTQFAEILGRPARLVNEIIKGKRGVSPETALDFSAAFGTSAQFWLNLESAYQLYQASLNERVNRSDQIARKASLHDKFPIQEMIKRGWIEATESFDVLESQVLNFFDIQSIEDSIQFSGAAKRNYETEPSQKQIAWLFRAKKLAESTAARPYSEAALKKALLDLEKLLLFPEEVRHSPRILEECGVRLVVVEPLPGSKICGACFWINDNKSPVIALTLRLDRIDNFWFVLRHEIEHVLRGDGKSEIVVDEALESGELSSEAGEEAELAANNAASEFCTPQDQLLNFIARKNPIFAEKYVLGFAKRVFRHPGIVVGQIQNKTKKWNLLRKHLVKVRNIIVDVTLTDGYGVSSID